MPKNAVKPEAAEPYTEQTSLGGPIPVVMGGAAMACRMKISGKALQAAGMKPNDQIELIAGAGEIRIRKIGEPEPSIWSASEPRPSARKIQLDDLMRFAREKEARARGEYDEGEDEEPEAVDEAGLNEDQVSREL